MIQSVPFADLREGARFIVKADLEYTGGVAIRVKTGGNTYRFEDNELDNSINSIAPHINVVPIIKLKG